MPDDLKPGDAGYVAPTPPTPLTAEEITALQTELTGLKDTTELQAEQIALYKANQPAPPPEPTETPVSAEFEGLENNDVITVGDLKKIMGGQEQRYGGIVTELEFKTQHSDFDATIQSYLPELVKGRPDLTKALRTSGNPALLAYELVTHSPKYIKDLAEGKLEGAEDAATKAAREKADKITANAGKPGAASGAPGGGAGESGVNYVLNMSDDDLEAHIAKIKAKE